MVGLAPPSLLGSGSRHCYGINYTHCDVTKGGFADKFLQMVLPRVTRDILLARQRVVDRSVSGSASSPWFELR